MDTKEAVREHGYKLLEIDPIEGKRYLSKYDLKYLCKDMLGYADWDDVHDDIQSNLDTIRFGPGEKGREYRLYLIPRGHLKSSIITKGWSIQQFLRNPNVRILIVNAIWDNARGFVRTMLQFMEQQTMKDLFGDFKPAGSSGVRWGTDGFTVAQRTVPQDAATVTSAGVERTQTSQHYDIIILDDIVVRENVSTPEQRRKVKNYYRDCLSLLEPDGVMLCVGTTWHDDDLYSSVDDEEFVGLMHDPDFKVFKRVAETGTEDSVLFKKKFNYKMLQEIRRKQGDYLYSSQYLLNPYPDETQTFKKGWLKYWRHPHEAGVGAPLENSTRLYTALTIDPSMGKTGGDYSAIVVVGVDELQRKFVLEARRFKRKIEDFPKEVVAVLTDLKKVGFEVNIIGLESFGFQQSLLMPIRTALSEAGLKAPIELLPTPNSRTGQKEIRIQGLIPDVSSGMVLFHAKQKDVIDELIRFNPAQRNKHDDLIDALAWNKIYWDRKPKEREKMQIVEGSMDWWIKKLQRKSETKDLFMEYRT